MKKNTFYLTTTLPYVNGEPHIGHALEFIQADVLVRYHKQIGDDVYFNTGTDEHGLKMYQKALDEGKTPKEYVDFYSERFKEFCRLFNIEYTRFIRTTDADHIKAAQKFWEASLANGDIYKKQYEGLYCVGCEEFKTDKDLVDGKCPLHNTVPIKHSEENYFFKFSKYQDKLLELYKRKDDQNGLGFVEPESKLKEITLFVERGLIDFSISRHKKNLPWGVPVPGDEEQVMYVWFDALVNYITTVGYGSDEATFKKWWPGLQVCGPDNLRFQSAMWQAMLMSAGVDPSRAILVHGMILAEDGTKMSKTLGNVVSPFKLLEKYGYEAVRYYLVSGIPTFGDSAFSYEQLEAKYKADLQNNFGNLLNRVVTLIKKKEIKIDEAQISSEVKAKVDESFKKYNELINVYDIYEAMAVIQELANYGNGYITREEPWSKDKTQEQITVTLNSLNYLLSKLIEMYTPVIPESAAKAKSALQDLENIILFPALEIK